MSTYTSYGIKCLYRITVGTERALDLSFLVQEATLVDSDFAIPDFGFWLLNWLFNSSIVTEMIVSSFGSFSCLKLTWVCLDHSAIELWQNLFQLFRKSHFSHFNFELVRWSFAQSISIGHFNWSENKNIAKNTQTVTTAQTHTPGSMFWKPCFRKKSSWSKKSWNIVPLD